MPAPRPSPQGLDSPLAQLQLQFKQLHQEQLRQQKQQTESQNQMMVMMLYFLTRINVAPTAPIPRSVTPPPPAVQLGPAVATPAHNPWTLPQAPAERPVVAGECRLCATHVNHICLHSTHSECSSSPRPPAVHQLPTLTQPPPQCPVDRWIQHSVLDRQVVPALSEAVILQH